MACVFWSSSGPRPLTYSVDDDETGSRIFAKTLGFGFRLLSGGGGGWVRVEEGCRLFINKTDLQERG